MRLVQTPRHNVIPSNKLLCGLKWCAARHKADSPEQIRRRAPYLKVGPNRVPPRWFERAQKCRVNLTYDKTGSQGSQKGVGAMSRGLGSCCPTVVLSAAQVVVAL